MPSPITFERCGPLLRATAPAGLSHHGQRVIGQAAWLATNAYLAKYQYETTYLELGAEPTARREDQGVLPVLFEGPGAEPWAVVTNPYGSRDREVLRPVGGAPVGDPLPPWVGTPLWLDGDVLVLGNSPKKPDHWLRVDLRSGKRSAVGLAEYGNGWSIVRDGRLLAHVCSDGTGYLDQEGRRVIELPLGQWVLSGLSALGDRLVVTIHPSARLPEALWVAVLQAPL